MDQAVPNVTNVIEFREHLTKPLWVTYPVMSPDGKRNKVRRLK